MEYAVYNLLGEVVYEATYNNNDLQYVNTIDVSQLPNGAYFLQVNNSTYKVEVVR